MKLTKEALTNRLHAEEIYSKNLSRDNYSLGEKLVTAKLRDIHKTRAIAELISSRESLKFKLSGEQAEVVRLRGLLAAEIELRKELSEELLRRATISPFYDLPALMFSTRREA